MSAPIRKVAYVASSRVPSRAANTVHVMNMSAALAEQGVEVALLARGDPAYASAALSDFGISTPFDLDLHPLRTNGLADRLSYLRHVRRRLVDGGFDFAYGRSTYALLLGVPRHIPLAYDLHVFPTERSQRMMEKMLFWRPNFLFATAITRALVDRYSDAYPQLRGRILLAPCAARPAAAAGQDAAPAADGRPLRVYYVGHLYEGRGIDLILAVAALEPEVEFHIVGGEEADVARWSAQAPPNAVFHGYVKPAELGAHYARADICIAPHQKKVTGAGGGDIGSWMSPMKLFEYMSHRKPIVAADLPVIREVLTDGTDALLCEPGNVEAWRAAVRRLRDDPSLRAAMAEAAFARLSENYTWSGRARAVLARANEELARKGGGAA